MSLEGDYDPANVFARILRGEIAAAKVLEDAEVLAFMDAFPQARGHTLVISKTSRARNLFEVEPPALASLMSGVQRVARAIRAALKPDGVAMSQFNGAAAGQTVFHLHVHLIPRWEGEALRRHAAGQAAEAGALKALAAQIAAEIT